MSELMWEAVDLNGSANDANPDGETNSIMEGEAGSWWKDARGALGDLFNFQLEKERIKAGMAGSQSPYVYGRDAGYQGPVARQSDFVMIGLLLVAALVVVKLVKD